MLSVSMTTKRDSPFAALEQLRAQLPAGETPRAESPNQRPAKSEKPGPARAVVRLERKQRRGKEVTVVEKLGLPAAELERWCKQLKQTLGCGGSIEGETIVLQGDFRIRLPDVLTKLGVRTVTVSN
jgi:translation initiation factor 1